MNTPTFYEIIEGLTKQFPNNMELGTNIRNLVWKIKDANQPDPNQLEIPFPNN